jgi:hypothetical protein
MMTRISCRDDRPRSCEIFWKNLEELEKQKNRNGLARTLSRAGSACVKSDMPICAPQGREKHPICSTAPKAVVLLAPLE